MFSIAYFRLVFTELLFVIICGMESEVGNYSIEGYYPCGISKRAPKFEPPSNCFEYHKDFVSNLRDARPAQIYEAPWMVSIQGRTESGWWLTDLLTGKTIRTNMCGGVLIGDKWLLTAAHCLGYDKYRVFIHQDFYGGDYIESEGHYRYPNYEAGKPKQHHVDIGLIKMKEPSSTHESGRGYTASTICLPPKDFLIRQQSRYALLSGWAGDQVLRVGPIVVREIGYTGIKHVESYLKVFNTTDQPRSCRGDSGSPIWIYHMGRAVLVGINTGTFDNDEEGCGKKISGSYVPHFIDWILETIKQHS